MAMMRVPEKRAGGIPQYRQQAVYDTTPGANLSARLSDNAGGIAAQGAREGWQAVSNTGKAVQVAAKVGFDLYSEYSRTKAMEAYNRFQESMQADLYGENGIFNRKGEKALNAVPDAEKLLRERASEFSRDLGDMGKEFFEKQLGTYNRQLLPQVQRHETSQFNEWRVNTAKTRAELAKNAALENYGDPEVFAQKVQESGVAIMEIANINGWSREQTELATRENASGIYLDVGNAALSRDDLKQARSVLASGMLTGEDKIRLEAAIRNKQEQLEAKARAEAERARAAQERAQNQAATQLGLSILNESIENPEKAKERLSGIEDPVFRQKVMTSYMTGASLNARMDDMIKEYQKTTSYNDGVSKLDAIMKDASLSIEQKNAGIVDLLTSTSDSSVRKQLDEEAKYRINGIEAPVNNSIWAEAQMYAAQPGVTPDMVTARFMGVLPPSYLEKVRKSSQDQQWKQEEQLLKDEIISILKNDYQYNDTEAQAVYRLILSGLNGTVGYEARKKKIPSLIVKVSVEKDRPLLWNKTKNIPSISIDYYKSQGWYNPEEGQPVSGVPDEDRKRLEDLLRSKGANPTPERILEAYMIEQQGASK